MYWYFKCYWIFLLKICNKYYYFYNTKVYLLNKLYITWQIFIYNNNLILGLILFKNLTEISIILLNYNIFLLEIFLDIKIILILK